MKQLYIIPLLIALAGCADHDHADDDTPTIRLALTAEPAVGAVSRQVIEGTALPQGTEIGLFAYAYTAGDPWVGTEIYGNEAGTVGAATAGGSPITALPEERYTTGLHAFYAYYPHKATLTTADPVIRGDLFVDADADGKQIDWLASSPQEGIVARATPVDLVFDHLTAMIRIKAGKNPPAGEDVKLERIEVTTADSQKFEYNLRTRVLTSAIAGGATTIVPVLEANGHATDHLIEMLPAVGDLPATLAASVLVLPLSEVTKLSFVIDGTRFDTPDSWNGFTAVQAGQYTTIYLTAETGHATLEVGELEYADGGNNTIALQQRGFGIGQIEWNNEEETINIPTTR